MLSSFPVFFFLWFFMHLSRLRFNHLLFVCLPSSLSPRLLSSLILFPSFSVLYPLSSSPFPSFLSALCLSFNSTVCSPSLMLLSFFSLSLSHLNSSLNFFSSPRPLSSPPVSLFHHLSCCSYILFCYSLVPHLLSFSYLLFLSTFLSSPSFVFSSLF